jgi:hypothetical protein
MSNQSDLAKSAAGFNGDPLSIDTANNRVGIGTSSPSSLLDVDQSQNAETNIELTNTNTGSSAQVRTKYTTDGGLFTVGKTSNAHPYGGDAYIYNVDNTNLRFATSDTERMRIDSSGTVLINTTSFFQSTKVGIEAPNIDIFSVRGNNVGAGYRYDSTSSTGLAAYFSHSSNTVAAGSITIGSGSTSYNTSSDYRLKENVVELTDATERLKQLNPSRFNFIVDPNKTVDGFLAHEVQSVIPEAITGTHNEVDADGNPVYQGIDQSKLVPLLTAALKEAITKIETLETEMTSVKARLDALEGN